MPVSRPVILRALLVALAATTTLARGQATPPRLLEVGDDAPPLLVDAWIQGETIDNLDRGRVYVLDFFAPGCGACRVTIPHLNALAAKFPQATFVGVALDTGFDPDALRQARPTAQLARYRVAIDRQSDEGGEMYAAWLGGARFVGSQSITFIVDADGQVAWTGSPMRAGEPLAQILAGTYDIGPARRASQANTAKVERRFKAMTELRELMVARRPPPVNREARLPIEEQVFGKYPETADLAAEAKFRRLMGAKQFDEAYQTADVWAAAASDDPQQLNELAWYIVDEEGLEHRDLDRARRYAERAVELTDSTNAAILDTLAKAIYLQGDVARAIELQTRSLELADEKDQEQLRVTLQIYKNAAATRPAR